MPNTYDDYDDPTEQALKQAEVLQELAELDDSFFDDDGYEYGVPEPDYSNY